MMVKLADVKSKTYLRMVAIALSLVIVLALLLASSATLIYAQYGYGGGGVGGGGPIGQDKTPPRISNIVASDIGKTTADIYWKTHELSDSQVEYWASPSMFSALDEERVINHHVRLTDLTPATTYHYKTMSRDRAGNLAVSDKQTFSTLGTPATFSVKSLKISSAEAGIGESVTISVLVTNSGDAIGDYKVTLKIDRATVATKQVTVAGGTSQKVSFTTSQQTAKRYSININGLSGSFIVKPAAPTPPAPTPAPPAPAPTPAPTPPAGQINWWLIGGIVAVIVVAIVVWQILRRRE